MCVCVTWLCPRWFSCYIFAACCSWVFLLLAGWFVAATMGTFWWNWNELVVVFISFMKIKLGACTPLIKKDSFVVILILLNLIIKCIPMISCIV